MKTKVYGFWIHTIVIIYVLGKSYIQSRMRFFNLELKFRNDTIIPVRNRHKNSIKLKDGFQNFWVEVPSNGDHMYLITFIDNFSQKSWDYFLKQKANACKKI